MSDKDTKNNFIKCFMPVIVIPVIKVNYEGIKKAVC